MKLKCKLRWHESTPLLAAVAPSAAEVQVQAELAGEGEVGQLQPEVQRQPLRHPWMMMPAAAQATLAAEAVVQRRTGPGPCPQHGSCCGSGPLHGQLARRK